MKKRAFLILSLAVILLFLGVNINNAVTLDENPATNEILTGSNDVNGENIKLKEAGSMIKASEVDFNNLSMYFQSCSIRMNDNVYSRINEKSYADNPNIPLSQLRYIKVLHYNYNGEIQVGELIVNAEIAEDCKNIFKELFQYKYQINSIRLIDDYWTENAESADNNSMSANNSSAFCYRVKTGGSSLSNHALGYAVDINPVQNPYVSGTMVLPSEGEAYVNRDNGHTHMIDHDDICYNIFIKYGFTWGGDWNKPKDYQHFEKTKEQ